MKMISLLLLISVSTAYAAPAKPKAAASTATATSTTPVPVPAPATATSNVPTGPASGTSTAAPAPTPIPWKLVYSGEYYGPRLSNFDLTKTQGPSDPAPGYTQWDHSLKVGYMISPEVVLGTQLRALSPFDPTQTLTWKNTRIYASWKHMIDTSDVDMQGVLDVELPTSLRSKNQGMIVAFNIKNNWTFKTSLRNWSFSAMTLIRPSFFNVPNGKSDILVAIYPSAQLDLFTDFSLLIEGGFDAVHSYNDAFFDVGEGDPDSINLGVSYNINSHITVNPALTFYTDDFSVPLFYFALSAAL